MLFKLVIILIILLISSTTCEEMTVGNITCALCLVGATEIEAMSDDGIDEELMIGYLIHVRIKKYFIIII